MPEWIVEALVHGAVLCASMGALIGASLWHDPKIWLNDAPPAIRAQVGPIDAHTKRRKSAWSVVMLLALVLVFARLLARVAALHQGQLPFVEATLAALICFELFNLFDALVIDLGLALFRPRWAMLPGVDTSSLRDVRWHVRNFLLGALMGLPFALLVAGLGVLVLALLGS